MADEDDDQKTEAPSGKRLDEARDKGQLPVSRELTTWFTMVTILVVMHWMLGPLVMQMADYLRGFIESAHLYQLDENNVQALMYQVLGQVALICGLVFVFLGAAIVGGVMIQTGFLFALDLMTPDLTRLMPSNGFRKLFSLNAVVDLGKSACKMVFLGGIAFSVLVPTTYEAPSYTGLPLNSILAFLLDKIVHLIVMLVLVFTPIAIGDYFYTRFKFMKSLRMTKFEVKDENKQAEGDPLIKNRLRQMRMEKARKRMMAQVPKADVVITNPTHYAIALQYDGDKMSAPVVIAKGVNLIAERIREVAAEHRIPLVSNPPLARALHDSVEVDQQIPGQHYRAVAEVISYVYKLRKRKF